MTRWRLLLVLPFLVLLAPTPAAATGAEDVASALRRSPVFVQSGSGVPLDVDRVRDTIASGSTPIYVAALPARAWQSQPGTGASAKKDRLLRDVRAGLGDEATVLLAFGDRSFQAGSGKAANDRGIFGGTVIEEVLSASGRGDYDEAAVTQLVVEFVSQVQAQDSAAGGSTSGGSGSGDIPGFPDVFEEPVAEDSAVPEIVLGTIAVGALGGGVLLYTRSRRRRLRALEEDRADVESLYDRLGSDVSTLSPGDDAVARQALNDAAERYNATGALMAKADTPGEFAAARRTAIEGLTAARVVRERLGLDPGPELPPPPSAGPVLTARQAVQVGDEQYEGSPSYEPGRSHWFGGGNVSGRYVPGGWYGVPFWETLLVTSVLTGGFGGGLGGGGYDAGYQDGADDRDSGGGGWGGDSGGGSSGGDSGGGSWGGDSGGGGSGGDSGGGSW